MYRQISLEPHYARINWQDMNQYILIDKEGLTVTTEKGYRMARTNVCVRQGEWYIEFKIERGGGDQGGHTRIGFARRESTSFPMIDGSG
jgi:COMPASS component BRE2